MTNQRAMPLPLTLPHESQVILASGRRGINPVNKLRANMSTPCNHGNHTTTTCIAGEETQAWSLTEACLWFFTLYYKPSFVKLSMSQLAHACLRNHHLTLFSVWDSISIIPLVNSPRKLWLGDLFIQRTVGWLGGEVEVRRKNAINQLMLHL